MVEAVLRATRPIGAFLNPVRRLQLACAAVALAAWELIPATGLVYRGVFPSTVAIGSALAQLLSMPTFWENLQVTLTEIVIALCIGTTLGIVVGVGIGGSRIVAAAFDPLVNGFASTPKIIFLPIFYLAFGIGMGSKIAVGTLAAFIPIVISVGTAVLHINPTFIRVGRSFGLTRLQMLRKIYLPAVVEPVVNGMRIAAGSAIAVVVISETRFSYAGLGFMVIDAYHRARFAQLYALLVIIVALAVAANALVVRIRAKQAARRTTVNGQVTKSPSKATHAAPIP